MDLENLKNVESNSYKSRIAKSQDAEKEEERKVEPVAQGRTRKKSGLTTVRDVFISEDASSVKSYVLMDVLVPAIKKAVADIVTNGIEMILYGSTGGSKKRGNASRVSYASYYDRKDERRYGDTRLRAGYTYDDVVFDSRGEAEDVLDRMYEMIDRFGWVTVADLLDMAQLTANFTDNKYGWTNLRNSDVVRLRDGGYMIKLPKAVFLER